MLIPIGIAIVLVIVAYYFFYPTSKLHTLKDKRVLVTGASGGIGEQIAYLYAKHGASVVVTARRQTELTKVSEKCAALSSSSNAKFFAVTGDMSLSQDTKRVIEIIPIVWAKIRERSFAEAIKIESMKLLGGLDILVLNHISGFQVIKYDGSQKCIDNFEFDLQVGFMSYVQLASHALSELKANNGSIIILNSLAGKIPLPGMLTYAASKHALNGFFHSLRNEMKAFGGNVSVTNCTVGLTGSDVVKDKMKQYLGNSNTFMSLQTTETTAKDVVEAGARRVDRAYTPVISGRLMTLIHAIWPSSIEYLFTSMTASMKNLDSL